MLQIYILCSTVNTPIILGAKYNSVDAVLQLVKMGCNSSLSNRVGETGISISERLGNGLCKKAIAKYAGDYDTDSDEDDFFS